MSRSANPRDKTDAGRRRRRGRWWAAALVVAAGTAALTWGAWVLGSDSAAAGARATLSAASALSGGDTAGYARAMEPRPFRWPADHGPHPEYRTEWWYVTGHLESASGRQFGIQLTFFRSAVAPRAPDHASVWSTNQVWLAHAALTDVEGDRHLEAERMARGAAGLAGGRADPFRVWVDAWELRAAPPAVGVSSPAREVEASDALPIELSVDADRWAAELVLTPGKPVVLQGERGWSRKGPEAGNASYYYSFTRLGAHGSITLEGEAVEVEGEVWMDREWSTSALDPDLEGWDWFSLQLSDRREIMFFELRRRDGTRDPLDHGVLVEPSGVTRMLDFEDVRIEVLDWWESPIDRASYPSGWRVEIPEYGVNLMARPLVRNQEMDLSFRYWEGAVDVEGEGVDGPVEGRGYVELTGYGDSVGLPATR